MTSRKPELDIQALRDAVQKWLAVSATLSGASMADVARGVFGPHFRPRDHGYTSLRRFLEDNVPELRVVGQSGMDILYAWESNPQDDHAPIALRASQTPWSAWAIPGSDNRVAVSDAGSARVVASGEQLRSGERVLPSTTAKDHRGLAGDFLTTAELTPGQRGELEQALSLTDDRWWGAWVRAVRRDQRVNRAWLGFRRKGLSELLSRRLRAEGVLGAAASAASASLLPRSFRARPAESSGDRLRTAVHRAIDQLPRDALRELKLPVGLVFDALEEP